MTQELQPDPSSAESTSPKIQITNIHNMNNMSFIDYTALFVRLFNVGQTLIGQTSGVADRLCEEVAQVTQGTSQLFLHQRKLPKKAQPLFPNIAVSFPVQSHNFTYGELYIAPDPTQPTSPALPLSVAHLLAHVCGWLLYTCELSALLQSQLQKRNNELLPSAKTLTHRQMEVLLLMCRGYNQNEIAKSLSIAEATVRKHRQSIYEQLGAHSEHDALLIAYQIGIFSPLDDYE